VETADPDGVVARADAAPERSEGQRNEAPGDSPVRPAAPDQALPNFREALLFSRSAQVIACRALAATAQARVIPSQAQLISERIHLDATQALVNAA